MTAVTYYQIVPDMVIITGRERGGTLLRVTDDWREFGDAESKFSGRMNCGSSTMLGNWPLSYLKQRYPHAEIVE